MKKKLLPALIVTGLIILVVIIMGITALINKYTLTRRNSHKSTSKRPNRILIRYIERKRKRSNKTKIWTWRW